MKNNANHANRSANRATIWANLRAIFALPKWLKIFLGVLSIIAVVGIVGTLALNQSVKGETYSANLSLHEQKVALDDDKNATDGEFSYTARIHFEKYAALLRSSSISNVKAISYAWDSMVDSSAFKDLKHSKRNVFFSSTQDLSALGIESLGKVEYTIDFSPLLWNIIKIFVGIVALTLLLANTIKHHFAPFGRYDYALALILSLITLILCVGQVNYGHHWGGDFSQYIAEGISIATGTMHEQVANNTIMMDKTDGQYGPYATPWGFSLLLAPLYAIFGFNLLAFKVVGILCYVIFVGTFYIFCARRLPRIYVLCASLLFALNSNLINSASNNIMSDIPFLCFSFVAIMALGVLFGDKISKHTFAPYIFAILGGASMAYASAIRTNGLVILCALLCVHFALLIKYFMPRIFERIAYLRKFTFIDSPYKIFLHILPYLAFVAVYGAILLTLPSGKGNIHLQVIMGASIDSILHNIDSYLLIISEFLSKKWGGGLAVLMLCMPLILLGIKQSIYQSTQHIFYVLCLLGSFMLIVLWPPLQGLRYAFILLPFLVFYGAKGLTILESERVKYAYFVSIVFGIIIISFAYKTINSAHFSPTSQVSYGAYTKEARQVWDFIKENTPKNAMILCFKPRVLYLNTNRLSFASNNVKRLDEVDFVLITKDDYNMPNPNSLSFQTKTQLIFQNKNFWLYKVIK